MMPFWFVVCQERWVELNSRTRRVQAAPCHPRCITHDASLPPVVSCEFLPCQQQPKPFERPKTAQLGPQKSHGHGAVGAPTLPRRRKLASGGARDARDAKGEGPGVDIWWTTIVLLYVLLKHISQTLYGT